MYIVLCTDPKRPFVIQRTHSPITAVHTAREAVEEMNLKVSQAKVYYIPSEERTFAPRSHCFDVTLSDDHKVVVEHFEDVFRTKVTTHKDLIGRTPTELRASHLDRFRLVVEINDELYLTGLDDDFDTIENRARKECRVVHIYNHRGEECTPASLKRSPTLV